MKTTLLIIKGSPLIEWVERRVQILLLLLLFIFISGNVNAQQTGSLSGKVTDANSSPLPRATVVLVGTSLGTITDQNGDFTLNAPAGTAKVRISFVGYQTKELQAEVKAGDNTRLNFSLEEGSLLSEEVVIIGSRATSGRSRIDTPVPVDIIQAKEIRATGQVDITQILNFVAPSISSNRQPGGDGSAHIDPVALRGVAPDQTLVLINGKRRHGSALVNVLGTPAQGSVAVDFNSIPVGAIERIEVLRDGAAAQYGSDAIAGVVNIVLKKETENISVTTTAGAHSTKFRNTTDGTLFQTDINYGFGFGNGGYLNLTAQINQREGTRRGGYYELTNRLTNARQYWYSYAAATPNEEVDAKELSVDRYSSVASGNAAQNGSGLFFNAAIPLGLGAEVYAFGGIGSRESNSPNNAYRFPNGTSNIRSISSRYVPELYPDGFLPENVARINDKSFTAGLRGNKSGWDVDLSNTFGSNSVQYYVENTLNASLGASSPTRFYSGKLLFSQNTTNLGFVRKFNELSFGQSLGVAFGAEHRIENYQIEAGEEASYKGYGRTYVTLVGGTATGITPAGAQAFPGYQPGDEQDETRSNIGLYGDLEYDITNSILLTGALRYENYSDFGDKLTWKASTRIKLTDDIALRGAVSTGFRAPSLQQQYYSATTSIPQGDGSLLLSAVANNESAVTKAFGVPQLKAETSFNLSAGATARLFNDFNLTVDAYQIDIDDRVTLTGFFQTTTSSSDPVVQGAAAIVANLLSAYPDVNSAQFFSNSIDTRTRGIDAILSYRSAIGKGILNVSVASNFTRTEVVNVKPPVGLVEGASTEVRNYLSERIFFDRLQKGRYERGTPQDKIILSASYTYKKLTPFVRLTRFGEYTSFASQNNLDNPTGARDQTFTSKWVSDLTLSYQLAPFVSITAGANNLFDVYPDEQIVANNQTGALPYGTAAGQQFGFNGAFYYGRLTFSF
ncbi:MAG: TonB-dependent receptor [Cytophagales bacterium]|nr:TonB-dependent receptor [Cytophagales bacterium]